MNYIMVDIESDGPAPGLYSMIAFGAIVVEESLNRKFGPVYLKPISDQWFSEALSISGFSREETLKFEDPFNVMNRFNSWVKLIKKPTFIADNNGFDWSFINYYFWKYVGSNPFGFSSQNLNSIYKGLKRNMFASFKFLRKTKHDHNPLNDAIGNAEAMLTILKEF